MEISRKFRQKKQSFSGNLGAFKYEPEQQNLMCQFLSISLNLLAHLCQSIHQDEINSVVGDVVKQFMSAVTRSDDVAPPEMASQFLRSVTQTSHDLNFNVMSLLDDRSLDFVRMFDAALKNFTFSFNSTNE